MRPAEELFLVRGDSFGPKGSSQTAAGDGRSTANMGEQPRPDSHGWVQCRPKRIRRGHLLGWPMQLPSDSAAAVGRAASSPRFAASCPRQAGVCAKGEMHYRVPRYAPGRRPKAGLEAAGGLGEALGKVLPFLGCRRLGPPAPKIWSHENEEI